MPARPPRRGGPPGAASAPSAGGTCSGARCGGGCSQLWLHRLRQPTLVLRGDDDPVVPMTNARWLAHRIPGGRLQVVTGVGHLFLVDEPARVGIIDEFLA